MLRRGGTPRQGGRRAARARAAVLLGLAALALLGCRAAELRPAPPAAPVPEAERAVAVGLEALRAGDMAEAQARFRTAIQLDAAMVRAHLHYQETWLARARRGTALAEYRARYEKEPSGLNLYLYGRLFESPARKLASFAAALERDPTLAWAHLERALILEGRGDLAGAAAGLERAAQLAPRDPTLLVHRGYFFLRRRQPHRAMNCFGTALRIDPGDDQAYFGLYRTHARYDAARNAMRSLKECLFLQPTRSVYLEELREYAARHATFADLRELEDVLTRTAAAHPRHAELLTTLAWIHERTGRPYSAIRLLETGGRESELDAAAAWSLIGLHMRMGQYDRALAQFFRDVPRALLLDPTNRLRPRWERLEEAVQRATQAPTPAHLGDLARACAGAGWVREALQVYDRLRVAGPIPPEIEREIAECTAFLRFVTVLEDYFEGRYKRYRQDGERGSLEEVLRDLSRFARLEAGVPDPGPLPVETYAFIGAMIDREQSRSHPITRYFERFNHYLLVGQRSGGPPEALVCARLHDNPAADRPRFGRRVPHRFIVGHDVKVRSFRESLDQNLGGVTVAREFFLNMDFIRRWRNAVVRTCREFSDPERRADLFHDPPLLVASREEALDVTEPWATRDRLLVRYGEEAGAAASDIAVFLDMVRTHEEGHVLDAERYLPLASNLWRILKLAAATGFSPLGVEAHLEGNAEVTALAEGLAPRLSLAQLVGFLPAADAAPPHSVGYFGLLQRLVAAVYDDPARFPGIDRRRNILQQLVLLEPEALRRLARESARERNLMP